MIAIFLVVICNINTDNNHTYAIWMQFYSFNFRSIHLIFLHTIFQLIPLGNEAAIFFGLIVHVEFHVWHINQSIYLTYDEIKFTQKKHKQIWYAMKFFSLWVHEILSIQWLTHTESKQNTWRVFSTVALN